MRVLQISTYRDRGGAAIACQRVTEALLQNGVEASLLYAVNHGMCKAWERLCLLPHTGGSLKRSWRIDPGFSGVDITRTKAFAEADVIHLHWINQGFLSLKGLHRLLHAGKPVVITMHDMWYATSLCHHAGTCQGYLHECGNCPLLSSPSEGDLSRRVFLQKQEVYAGSSFVVTAVSEWLRKRAAESTLLKGHPLYVVPNLLPANTFVPQDKVSCRKQLSLPLDKPIIVFVAARIDDANKDFSTFTKAVNAQPNVHVALVGAIRDASILQQLQTTYTHFGSVCESSRMSQIYSAADVCVSTSHYETFGQTLAEAQACGCIPVAFAEGGQTDIIDHLNTGYLASEHTAEAIAQGIKWALSQRASISPEVLHKASLRFSAEAVAKQYIKIYESITR